MLPREVYNYLKFTTHCTPCASMNKGKYHYYVESTWILDIGEWIICTRYPIDINRDNWDTLKGKIKHNYPLDSIPDSIESDWQLSYYNEC